IHCVFSHYAVFNQKTHLWELPVPSPQNVGTYRLQVHAYCAQDNSLCAIRYGQSRQLEWEYHFRAVIAQPQNLTFKVRLAGVNGVEAKGATINVKLKLKDGTVLPLDKPLVLNPVGTNGVYEATATLTNPLPSGTTLRVLVKGEKHSQVVFCHPSGQTEPCNDTDYITPSSYSFDFTGRPLPPGDLNQDGTINNTDLTLLTDTFKKPSSQVSADDLKHADVNYDGYVDNFDLGFILQSLSTRYDE
ncbi:MAG: dockerin type I repeat-containing protein, partial [Candidatus Gottesmanbacteria bacterium]|nr:dockerin type I repeat-containing protein [Candidatus Gottesmanbacteria bacterium]